MLKVGGFKYDKKDVLGKGAFGVVYKGRSSKDVAVAVKVVQKEKLGGKEKIVDNEKSILMKLQHENIVALLHCAELNTEVVFVFEFCNKGDLAQHLSKHRPLQEPDIRVLTTQIAAGLEALRRKDIVHRDLKPQNILLNDSGNGTITYKIADFGLSKCLPRSTQATSWCGTPLYMAPEVYKQLPYDAKADLWSIGIIIIDCLGNESNLDMKNLNQLTLRGHLCNLARVMSPELRNLLIPGKSGEGLLHENPEDRINFESFFKHPFLRRDSALSMPGVSQDPCYVSMEQLALNRKGKSSSYDLLDIGIGIGVACCALAAFIAVCYALSPKSSEPSQPKRRRNN